MPRAPRVCNRPGCPDAAGPDGRCETHRRPAWSTSDRASRLPRDWPQRRRLVLARDRHRCRIAGAGCTVRATEVDHVVAGDDHRLENLQAVCSVCHTAKTLAERQNR